MPDVPLWNDFVGLLVQWLTLLHRWLGSFGLAIIVFTVAIRIVMLPLTIQQLRSSREMQRLQPLLAELQRKYGRDRAMLAQEQMRLYREHGINPMAGCLPMLLQMPIWIGLYQALFQLSHDPQFAGAFLWVPDLSRTGTWTDWWAWPLALFTGASQWVLQKMMTPHSNDPQQQMMASVMNVMPIMFIFFAFQVPHGLVLYWAASNVVSLVQQYFFTGWGSLRPQPGAVGPAMRAARAERPAEASGDRPAGAPSSERPLSGGIRTYTLEPDAEGSRAVADDDGAPRPPRPPRRKRRRS